MHTVNDCKCIICHIDDVNNAYIIASCSKIVFSFSLFSCLYVINQVLIKKV